MKAIKGILLSATLLAIAAPLPLKAQDIPIETQIVDALNKVYGVHPRFRANHAKGIVTEGTFKPSPDAAVLCKASLFQGSTIPATIRFSDGSGIPNVADGAEAANPHGMAIKFRLPDGSETDMVIVALKFFPVATGPDFRDLLLAIAASPPDAPKPTKFEEFLAHHPTVMQAFATAETPASFAEEQYNGINAFIFINKSGARQAVRYLAVPDKVVHLGLTEADQKSHDFLIEDLRTRLAKGPVTFQLKAQLAAPEDPTHDATKPWPEDRKIVDLGTLTINKALADSAQAEKKLLFLPGQVTEGIEVSDDPLINVRDGAYAVSFSRRNP